MKNGLFVFYDTVTQLLACSMLEFWSIELPKKKAPFGHGVDLYSWKHDFYFILTSTPMKFFVLFSLKQSFSVSRTIFGWNVTCPQTFAIKAGKTCWRINFLVEYNVKCGKNYLSVSHLVWIYWMLTAIYDDATERHWIGQRVFLAGGVQFRIRRICILTKLGLIEISKQHLLFLPL